MPSVPDNHAAHDYAERIRERLPRRLQGLREAAGLSMYALWMKCGVSRDMISRVEGGESIPTLHVTAQTKAMRAYHPRHPQLLDEVRRRVRSQRCRWPLP